MPQIFTEVRPRDGGPDRQKDVGSPVDVLVDTVTRMQQDLANFRAENRMLRTPGVPQVVRDPIYLAYVVGDSDNISETTRVVAVTRPRSVPDQIEDLLRRLLMAVDTPAPIPEVPAVKLLQRLAAETQSRPSPVVSPPESVGLEKMLRSFSGQMQTRPPP